MAIDSLRQLSKSGDTYCEIRTKQGAGRYSNSAFTDPLLDRISPGLTSVSGCVSAFNAALAFFVLQFIDRLAGQSACVACMLALKLLVPALISACCVALIQHLYGIAAHTTYPRNCSFDPAAYQPTHSQHISALSRTVSQPPANDGHKRLCYPPSAAQ